MSNKVIGYDNQLWRVIDEFSYTGSDQPFTLQPGEYLFICEGAHGGEGYYTDHQREYGAITYGEIVLDEETTFHAVVGSDGGDYSFNEEECVGGFNGGGHGGLRQSSAVSYYHGPGGGGATDIRLLAYDPNEYPTWDAASGLLRDPIKTISMQTLCDPDLTVYPELPSEYHKVEGYDVTSTSCNLDYTISEGIDSIILEMDVIFQNYYNYRLFTYANANLKGTFLLQIANGSIQYCIRTSNTNTITWTTLLSEYIAYKRYHFVIHLGEIVELYDGDTLLGTGSGVPLSSDTSLKLWLGINNSASNSFYGRIYRIKLIENNTAVVDLLPVSHTYEQQETEQTEYGFYDTIRERFLTFYNSNFALIPDPSRYQVLDYVQSWATSTSNAYCSAPINSYYVPKENTKITIDCVCFYQGINTYNSSKQYLFGCGRSNSETSGSKQFSFGMRYSNNGTYTNGFYIRDGQVKVQGDFKYHERIQITCFENTATVSKNGTVLQTIEIPNATLDTPNVPIYICGFVYGTLVRSFSTLTTYANVQIYDIKFSEINIINDEPVEKIVRHFIPACDLQSSKYGLYDVIDHVFLEGPRWIGGPVRTDHSSLNSRIMVAGGAGGGVMYANTRSNGRSCGGGPYGTKMSPSEVSEYHDYPQYCFPTQSSGYAFGYGGTPNMHESNSCHGRAGAGGGWYGGYCSKIFTSYIANTSRSGGGGSSYVLTNQSYKPPGYIPTSKYYFTHVQMHAGLAMGDLFSDNPNDWKHGRVYICKKTNPQINDIIIYPCTGESVSHQLTAGKYRLKVWGGDGGGHSYMNNCARGGYSQGIFNPNSDHTIYVYTGGSGGPFPDIGDDDTMKTNIANANTPSLMYNGGTAMTNTTNLTINYASKTLLNMSGGGTDIRMDIDDLQHRIIVAGGAGSIGYNGDNLGGVGGGSEGGSATGSNGTNNGPGTQLSGYSFGNGGPGLYQNSGYGGCGGGGWYGGYGTTPTSSNNVKSGAGGSGYTLTKSSMKPIDYGCDDEEYYLTETTSISGGNNLPLWHTKTQIEVLAISPKCICQDEDGYKYYDKENERWVLLDTQELTEETFELYGSSINVDRGLLESYYIYTYDKSEQVEAINLYVVPNSQCITIQLDADIPISNNITDDVYNKQSFQVYYNTIRIPQGNKTYKTALEIHVDHILNNEDVYKAYMTQIYGSVGKTANTYLKLDQNGNRIFQHKYVDPDTGQLVTEERTMELKNPEDYRNPDGTIRIAQWLLPIGRGYEIPYHYHDDVVDDDVYEIQNVAIAEYDRTIYFAIACRIQSVDASTNTISYSHQLIIKAMNLLDQTVYSICRIPWRTIYPNNDNKFIGKMLVDDRYFYLQMKESYNTSTTYKQSIVRIHRTDFSVNISALSGEDIYGYGRMEWLDQNTILCHGPLSFMKYDTVFNVWSKITHGINGNSNTSLQDWALGHSQIVSTYVQSSNTKIAICDCSTFQLQKIITLPNAATTPRVCYDGIGKFYIATQYYLYEYDETTSELTKTINLSIMKYPNTVTCCNGAVIITQYSNYNNNDYQYDLILYRTEVDEYSCIRLPWTIKSTHAYDCYYMPFSINGQFFYVVKSALIVDYSKYTKYKFGPHQNRHTIVLNQSNHEKFTYDSRFVSVLENCIKVHNGVITYTLDAYNEHHIARTNQISKNDYRYLRRSEIIMRTQEGD